jgi:hypothetical protein
MDISATSHIGCGIANNKPNSSLDYDLELDCELLAEDSQGHHTFQANADMTKAILSFLSAL